MFCCRRLFYSESLSALPRSVEHCDVMVVYRLSATIFDFDPSPFTTPRDRFTRHSKNLVILCMHRLSGYQPAHPCRFYSIPPHTQTYVPLNRDTMFLELVLALPIRAEISVACDTFPAPILPVVGRGPHPSNVSGETSRVVEHVPADLYRFG